MPSSNHVLRRPAAQFLLASLAAALSMGVSHQALAACVGAAGGTIVCTDQSIIPFDNTVDFSSSGSNDNYAVKVMATPATDGTAIVTNSHIVSGTLNTLSATNTSYGVFGMRGADAFGVEEWNLINSGEISAVHAGLGLTAGVYLQNDAEAWNINNTGIISVTRGVVTSVTANATGTITARDAFGNTGTLNIAAAIYNNEEEIRDHNITNDGTISGTGQYAAGIFTRSNSFELVNNGTINGYEVAPVGNSPGVTGTAAAIVTWDGRLLKNIPDPEASVCNTTTNVCTGREAGFGKTFIENNGTINGNVIVTGLNGLQVMARIGVLADPISLNGANGAVPNANVAGGMVDRRDSEIENNGTITGNLYYGNGSHILNNTSEGTITGDVVVDMRRVTNYLDANNYSSSSSAKNDQPYSVYVAGRGAAFGEAEEGEDDDDDDDDEGSVAPTKIYNSDPGLSYAAALANAVDKLVADNPDRHFTFENAGVFNGNVSVLSVNHTFTDAALTTAAVPEVKITPQTVLLKTHITGSGTGSDDDDPSLNSGYINGRLFIGDGSMAGWTVNPTSSTISADGASGTVKTTITPVIDSTVRNGETFLVAKHMFGTSLPGVEEDSYLVDWEAYQVGGSVSGNALAIRASVKDAFDIDGISNPAAATLNGLIAAGSDDSDVLGALGGAVQSFSDEDDVKKAGSQLAPETNFATQQAAITLNSAIGQHIDTRLASVGGTGSSPGYTPGPSGLGMKPSDPNRSNLGGLKDDNNDFVAPRSGALWGQAFGVGMNQGERSQVDGYDARLYGILAGYDNWISPGVRVGVAGGYANTRIDGEGDTSRNTTDIDSYLVQAYGAIKNPGWYLSGRTGFTWHDYDTRRVLTVPFEDSAAADHDGRQFNASVELGAPMHFASTIVTPIASLTYSNLHQDGYTEESDGGMALRINGQSNDSLVSALGMKALIPIAADTVIEGRAAWLHEFSDTAQVVTAAFAAGGGTFTAAGPDVGRDTAALGAGILAQFNPGSTFELNYDANIREDYLAHIGSARVNIDF